MNILILTFGSRGDVQPYVALGRGLQSTGYTVTVCTCSSFKPFVHSYELNYSYMTDELLQLLDSDAGRDAVENTLGLFGAFKTTMKLFKQVRPIIRQMYRDSWDAAKAANPDMIIVNSKALGGAHIAEKLGVRVIAAMPLPQLVPTAEFPTIGFPDLNIGRWYNKLTYKLIYMYMRMYNGMVNEFRQDVLGLDKLPRSSGILRMGNGRPIPVLHCYSEHVLPRPTDWPDAAYVTGYWFLNQLDDWEPSKELQDFLDAGDPPVYVGFGSMAGRNPKRLASIVIEALQKANVRGIIATGWGGLETGGLPDSILKIDKAPHDWLFPRVAAVVHHGGAGTTAAGLRAGRPTVICPFFGDQPFWGGRVYALGAGPEPIPQKKLTVEKLANALRTVASNVAIREKAESLGERIRREDGISNAIAIIEGVLQQR